MFQTELDCFLKIIDQYKLKPEEIESVKIMGHPTLDAPCFTNHEITNIADIQFGAAYIFAMAANGVTKGVEWQDLETARSPRIQEFSRKVSFGAYPEYGQTQICKVEVVARNQTFKDEKPYAELHKLTDEELLEKFRHNASRILTQNKIDKALDILQNLEKVQDISELVSQITI
jgi:2-methylcitrate dehydratase PrpD